MFSAPKIAKIPGVTTKSPKNPEQPGQSPGDLLLEQTMQMLEPLIGLLIAQGVGYPSMNRALRGAFIDAARAQLETQGDKVTDAAVSVRSGVHRKEVRAASEVEPSARPAGATRALSIAEQVFTRWSTDATYRDKHGAPATLALSGDAPSFDSLVGAVTRDFSKRTLLDELLRMGLVKEDGDQVVPLTAAVVPQGAWDQLASYLGEHMHDHLAAGAANLSAALNDQPAPFLEHSMYANGISDLSIDQLSALARDVWKPAFNQMVGAARERYELERDGNHQGRLRFGVYVYSEPDVAKGVANQHKSQPAKTRKRSKKGNKRQLKK